MATNKNQHFVPRCYLKPFTKDAKDKAIILYNIDRQRFVLNAPVKNQCSRDYFYGQDAKLEKAIQAIERDFATALREILQSGYRITDECRQRLRVFWLHLYLRTEGSALRSMAGLSMIADKIGPGTEGVKISAKEAAYLGMLTFATNFHVIDDIGVCLVRNCSDTPFVTSDDPAVMTNKWHLVDSLRAANSFGVGTAGILCLLPLSPEVLFLGYDPDVYSVPNDKGWIRATRNSDIDAFNEHQFLNCRANIFLREESHQDYVRQAYLKTAGSRIKEENVVHYAALDSEHGQYKRYTVKNEPDPENDVEGVVHWQGRSPTPTSWPSLIQWRPAGCAYENGTGLGYIRRSTLELRADRQLFRRVRIP